MCRDRFLFLSFSFFLIKQKVHGFDKGPVNYLVYVTGASADRDPLPSSSLFICTFMHKTMLCINGNGYTKLL